MNNEYEMLLRDADMQRRKTKMMCTLSSALIKAGGNGTLSDPVIAFLETCARNGVRLFTSNTTGPYEQKLFEDGTHDHS